MMVLESVTSAAAGKDAVRTAMVPGGGIGEVTQPGLAVSCSNVFLFRPISKRGEWRSA
jgi:hypothetical protein